MGCMQIFSVGFCPGHPLEFHYDFEIQVAHFQPEIFHLKGCAFFPRVLLDLPLNTNGSKTYDKYCNWINQANKNLKCNDISQVLFWSLSFAMNKLLINVNTNIIKLRVS